MRQEKIKMSDFSLFPSWLIPAHSVCKPKAAKSKYVPTGNPKGRPINPDIAGRDSKFAALYRGGKTLEEIGRMHRISRQRVKQILGGMGIKAEDGGAAVRDRWTIR